MKGLELDPEEFPGLFDCRGFWTTFGWVQGMCERRVSVEALDDLFEDFFVVCYSRVDDCICE